MSTVAFKNNGGRRVAVIGGGAAGMMSAISAAQCGADVLLFEKNNSLGKKLRITGKGRCNVTNMCDTQQFMQNVTTNPRFLYTALSRFDPSDTMSFFEECGVPLKVERGKRVFPVSDKAQDIVAALSQRCRQEDVGIVNRRVDGIRIENGQVTGIRAGTDFYDCDAVIVCTGGRSYPQTGSDGDGYKFAREAGHTVTQLVPSLVPVVADTPICAMMQGLSLKNIRLKVVRKNSGAVVFEELGEMMFTHFGITGPLVLSASAHMSDMQKDAYTAYIDMKPALDESKLDARIVSDFDKYKNRDIINALNDLLPQKAIEPIIEMSGIDIRQKINSITREQRRRLVSVIKGIEIPLLRFRPIDEAIVTRGGVAVSEVSPRTMQSKLIGGLYFAGEVLDLDAYTGGFNLQIAFSTAVVAGESAAQWD